MNVGPLVQLDQALIQAIINNAYVSLDLPKDTADSEVKNIRSKLHFVASIAIAASGGHVAVSDRFFFECCDEIKQLSAKQRLKWKQKCADAKGTRRNVLMTPDGLIRVRDDTGQLAPMVPLTVSKTVNKTKDMSSWTVDHIPELCRQRMLEAMLCEPRPPPDVQPHQLRPRDRTKQPSI